MSKGKLIFAFSLGAAAGAVVSWRLLKKYYDNLINEEIAAFKESYKFKPVPKYEGPNDSEEEKRESMVSVREATMNGYKTVIEDNGYSVADEEDAQVKQKKEALEYAPFVIPPEEFGEDEDFETESLTYYADGVLTDDLDHPIEDVEALVGVESLTHFGEYEDDSVFVRNLLLRCDYEILKDERKYSDVIAQRGS